ncbi:hypothetical protein GCM10011391_28950 [Pullulanibacillus camelliae]|uniref:Uncharacterized protein n=1 Tax=Pullulanibacillus camelliae TaxID=1707096 RepID=A0A8J2YKM6_9BACL|nr:hypothetical protein [Pullulanibacillus camelliae]GGE48352.1 hypothetical protein GCM10011391_28950 [Pullulanibacillus camelliae]
MAKLIRDIQLGDYAMTLKEHDEGHYMVKLTSGSLGGLLEMERLDDDILRIRDLDIGSASVPIEYFALMLKLIGADEAVVEHIEQLRQNQQD